MELDVALDVDLRRIDVGAHLLQDRRRAARGPRSVRRAAASAAISFSMMWRISLTLSTPAPSACISRSSFMDSAAALAEGARTTVPRPTLTSTSCLAASARTASRTTVRLTPNWLASSRSEGRRSPAPRRLSRMRRSSSCSTRWARVASRASCGTSRSEVTTRRHLPPGPAAAAGGGAAVGLGRPAPGSALAVHRRTWRRG